MQVAGEAGPLVLDGQAGVLLFGAQQFTLRRITIRMPKIATDAARMPNASPSWLPQSGGGTQPLGAHDQEGDRADGSGQGEHHDARHGDVDDAGQAGLADAADHQHAEGDQGDEVGER